MAGKIVLCMQYWDSDRDQALKVARFIADIQPGHTRNVDFMFAARFDSTLCPDTIRHVSRKFNVWTHRTMRKEIGWPAGPNGMVADIFQSALMRYRSGAWKDVKAVWLLEADALPLKADWLERIEREWDEAGKLVMGAWSPEWSPVGHINGNLLFSPTLAEVVKGLEGSPPHKPWDTHHAQKLARHWHKSEQMGNLYRATGVKPKDLPETWAFVHGIKDDSGYHIARKRIFPDSRKKSA
jgi:hypothetical protein